MRVLRGRKSRPIRQQSLKFTLPMSDTGDITTVRYVAEHRFGLTPLLNLRRADGGGLSRTDVWRITTAQGEFALRAWPNEPGVRERVTQQLRWQHELRDLPYVAKSVASAIESHGRLWSLEMWLPGEPAGDDLPDDSIAQVFHALAEIHTRWARGQSPVPRPSPAAAKRWQRLSNLPQAPPHPSLGDLALRTQLAEVRGLADPHLPTAREMTRQLVAATFTLHPCLIDIRAENLLFTGEALTGVVDLGAAAIDTPLVDLSRALGELVGPDPARRAAALAEYEQLVPLQPGDREMIQAFEVTGLVIAAINWLDWLAEPQAADWNSAKVSARLAKLANRLAEL
jgi:Ser/Thr protein kinase RdoA (MazF antagonist)